MITTNISTNWAVWKLRFRIVISLVLTLMLPQVGATDLRGRVDGIHPYANSPFPFNGARVDIYSMTPQGPYLVYSTFTGADGMYYIRIPPGNYVIQINGTLNFPLYVNNQSFQDISPILLR
jgi:hypothetical protein